MRWCLFQFLLTSFISMSPSYADSLELPELLESVRTYYPMIRAANQDLEKSHAELLSAQGGFDPVFKAQDINTAAGYYINNFVDAGVEQPTTLWGTKIFAGWRLGQGNFPVYEKGYQTNTGGEIRGGIEVPLLKNGWIDERRAKIQTSTQGVEIAQASLALQKLEVIRLGTQKYWDWVAAGRKLFIVQELLNNAEVRDQGLLKRVKHGDAALVEQTDNQRAVVQRQAALISAERSLQKATLELSLYYRDSQGTPILVDSARIPKNLPEPNSVQLADPLNEVKDTLIRHPELKRFHSQTDQANVELSYSKNQILPKLDFKIGGYADLGYPTYDYLAPPQMKISLVLEFPLFFRSARGKAASAQAALNKIEILESLARDRIKTTLYDSYQAMEASKKRITFARQELTLARKLETAEKTRFQHGDSNFFTINIREQTTADAAIREVDALAEFFKSKADYEAVLAK